MYLDLTGRFDQVQECTSSIFEGLISMIDPAHSWVAKWQRLEGYVRGVYAIKVVGSVSSPCVSFYFPLSFDNENGKAATRPFREGTKLMTCVKESVLFL